MTIKHARHEALLHNPAAPAMTEPEVLIVGAGPVGLTLAIDLAWRGIEVTVVETRGRAAAPEPKCNHVAARTMEIFRRLGVAQSLREAGLPADYPNDISFKTTMLGKELAQTGNVLTASAPCAGSVVRLAVRSPRTAVREGDLLAEVVCTGENLQAELTLPQDGLALVRPGQPVKLLYEAFPYQRYGARSGTVRWVSPSGGDEKDGAGGNGKGAFRALADLKETSVLVGGIRRPVAPGMGGLARVLVGRRSLVTYAFEPLRQLRESLRDAGGK